MVNRLLEWVTILARKENDEEGQGLVEYGLILVLVAVVCVGALNALQAAIGTQLGDVVTAL